MRDLSATLLETEQKKLGYKPLLKVVLIKTDETTYTYTLSDTPIRLYALTHPESPYNQQAVISLDNSDGVITDIDFKGYQATISYGMTTANGDEYSTCAPVTVIAQQLLSIMGKETCSLTAIGVPNLMALDKANDDYILDATDTDTVKTLLRKICGDSGETILDCFDHCTSYDIEFDSEDSLIDTFIPKDAFRISKNSSRLDTFKKLMKLVGCVAIVKADGKWHIFVPEDTDLEYEYELVSGSHYFFAKTYRKRIVIPAYVEVSSRATDEGTAYTGYAEDTDTPAALRKREYNEYRVTSDAQCVLIATARLLHYQLDSERGAGSVPMNVGAECYDYVKMIDADTDASRIGNIGQLTRYFRQGKFTMDFHFGGVELGIGLIIPGFTGVGGAIDYYSKIMEIFSYLDRIVAILEFMENGSWAPEFRLLSVTNRLQIPSKTVGSDYL